MPILYLKNSVGVLEPVPAMIGPPGQKGEQGLPGQDGAPGRDGTDGQNGVDGAPGPNEITTATATNLSGLLKGNGTSIAAAAAGTDYAAPAVTLAKTLTAAGWASQQQTITDAAIEATSPGDLRIAQSATDAQAEAWGKALPRVVTQAAGSITVRAAGTVPTINIPVEVEVRG